MSVVNLRRRFEVVDWTQTSVCEVAVTAGNSDGLKSLLEQGEKISEVPAGSTEYAVYDSRGTLLQRAIDAPENEDVLKVLLDYGADPSEHFLNVFHYVEDMVPLQLAVRKRRIATARMLLAGRAKIDEPVKADSPFPQLHEAARQGVGKMVHLLIDSDSTQIRSETNEGWLPIHEAAASGNIECVAIFL